jgi:photosynthetic reaction center cytochrome c subunit
MHDLCGAKSQKRRHHEALHSEGSACVLAGLIRRLIVATLLCLITLTSARAQAAQDQKPLLAEEVFKNVQMLRGISVSEFMGTMGFFAASLGMNCVDCHTADSVGSWAKFADDTPRKQTTRKMVAMVKAINQTNFSGARMVTCYSCHRGIDKPEVTPSLAEQYGEPPPEDPDKVPNRELSGPTADQILDRYIQALGGAQQLAKLTSFTATGTYSGYDTDTEEVPIDIFLKAPNLRSTTVHAQLGTKTLTYDGRQAWFAGFDQPVPLLALSGGELEQVRIDAALAIPAHMKQDFTNWRAGFPEVIVSGRKLQVIEGTLPGGSAVKFYFDKESGLLARQVHYVNTVVGLIPTHVEYSDYREVAGVRLPFRWVTTWTDGQTTTKLTEIRPNAAIDASRFAKPAPAQPPKPADK